MLDPIAVLLRRTNNGGEDQSEWGNFLSDYRNGESITFIFMRVMVDTPVGSVV